MRDTELEQLADKVENILKNRESGNQLQRGLPANVNTYNPPVSVCPSCGYCPTCGQRKNLLGAWPYYPFGVAMGGDVLSSNPLNTSIYYQGQTGTLSGGETNFQVSTASNTGQ